MTETTKLLNKEESVEVINSIASHSDIKISISEDRCFNNKWISLGDIKFYRSKGDSEDLSDAVQFGGYIWYMPDLNQIKDGISQVLAEVPSNDKGASKEDIIKILEEGLQDATRRLCLLHPRFDTFSMGCFPLSRPTTVVPDTTAVKQGAVNFICKFFYPHVRIKIPGIVHLEIINQADKYINQRNQGSNKSLDGIKSLLDSHVSSQGSQRALLNFELSSEIQVERESSDSLYDGIISNAFNKLTNTHKDRLIIESAKKLQLQKPQEDVYLLTADHGQAKVAMAEGLKILFFASRNSPKIFGSKLPGCMFPPFGNMPFYVSLSDILWELAVTFGSVQIKNDNNEELQVWGIGGPGVEAGWQPFHVKEDLLWTVHKSAIIQPGNKTGIEINSTEKHPKSLVFYRVSALKLVQLIEFLSRHKSTTTEKIQKHLEINRMDDIRRYENFLETGEFISVNNKKITSKKSLEGLSQALKKLDLETVFSLLLQIPAFKEFMDFCTEKQEYCEDSDELAIPKTSRTGYYTLGEIVGKIYRTSDKKIIVTQRALDLNEFVNCALTAYQEVSRLNDSLEWILTGAWLDFLARKYSIHPLVSKELLLEARNTNLLNVFFEGSTPDRRFDTSVLNILSRNNEDLTIQKVFLYHGNFLLPGTSSVRLKLQGGNS